jgi:hypothetical protein
VAATVLGAGLGGLVAATRVLANHWARSHPEDAALLRAAFARAWPGRGPRGRVRAA